MRRQPLSWTLACFMFNGTHSFGIVISSSPSVPFDLCTHDINSHKLSPCEVRSYTNDMCPPLMRCLFVRWWWLFSTKLFPLWGNCKTTPVCHPAPGGGWGSHDGFGRIRTGKKKRSWGDMTCRGKAWGIVPGQAALPRFSHVFSVTSRLICWAGFVGGRCCDPSWKRCQRWANSLQSQLSLHRGNVYSGSITPGSNVYSGLFRINNPWFTASRWVIRIKIVLPTPTINHRAFWSWH